MKQNTHTHTKTLRIVLMNFLVTFLLCIILVGYIFFLVSHLMY